MILWENFIWDDFLAIPKFLVPQKPAVKSKSIFQMNLDMI